MNNLLSDKTCQLMRVRTVHTVSAYAQVEYPLFIKQHR